MLPVVFGALGLMGLAAANEGTSVEAPLKVVSWKSGREGNPIVYAFYAGFMLPERLHDGKIGQTMLWIENSIQGGPGYRFTYSHAFGQALAIADYLTQEPGFGDRRVTASMVKNAVENAALPGLEGAWERPLRASWRQKDPNWWGWLTGDPRVTFASIIAYLRTDVPVFIKSSLDDAGIKVSKDQTVNALAIGIYLLSLNPLIGKKIYEWIAEEINSTGLVPLFSRKR